MYILGTLHCRRAAVVVAVVTFRMHFEYIFLDLDSVLRFISLFIILLHSFAYAMRIYASIECFKVVPIASVVGGIVPNEVRVRFRQWRALKRAHTDGTRRRQIRSTRHVSFLQFCFYFVVDILPIVAHTERNNMQCTAIQLTRRRKKLVQYHRRLTKRVNWGTRSIRFYTDLHTARCRFTFHLEVALNPLNAIKITGPIETYIELKTAINPLPILVEFNRLNRNRRHIQIFFNRMNETPNSHLRCTGK